MTTSHITDAEWNTLSDSDKLDYVRTLERLLAERDRLLDAIPECPAHGSGCIPHALEWIERLKGIAVAYYGTPPHATTSPAIVGLYEDKSE